MSTFKKPDRGNNKRKKHNDDSSQTLDQFFSKKPITPSSKKLSNSNLTTYPTPKSTRPALKPKRINSNNNNSNNNKTETETSRDQIILIDSDDEEVSLVYQTPTRKKMKHNPNTEESDNSDIEIVDCSFTIKPKVKGSWSMSNSTGAVVPRFGFDTKKESSRVKTDSGNTSYTFGKPALLSATSLTTDTSSTSWNFGLPSNLLGPRPNPQTSTSTLTLDCTEPITRGESLIRMDTKVEEEIQVDLDLTRDVDMDTGMDMADEWLMGDDEDAGSKTLEDGDSGYIEDMLLDKSFVDDESHSLETCPFCEKKLSKLTPYGAEAHINSCLESEDLKPQLIRTSTSNSSGLSKCGFTKPTSATTGNNAFSVLMSSFKENEAWTEATRVEDKSLRPIKANGGRRKAPFYKVLQGMPIAVDAFRYGSIPGVTAYFLSHAHSDHYTNLSSTWKHGPIYCSKGTANLIIHMLSVDKKWVHPLPMNEPTIIPNTNGVQVTLIEANHCPGSCLFLFEGQQTVNAGDSSFKSAYVGSDKVFRYLHCGDFRASPRHVMHPAVRGKKIDHVYLDTTYLDPKYTFPPQPLVISACAELARRLVSGERTVNKTKISSFLPSIKPTFGTEIEDKILIVVGTYSIGKERVVKAIAKALDSKIYCDKRKTALLRCEDDEELEALLTSDPLDAMVHIVPLSTIATDKLQIYMEQFKGYFTKLIGFRPTGWTFCQPTGTDLLPSVTNILARKSQKDYTYESLKPAPKSTSKIKVFPVPYSEHSSFYELTCFAMSFNWTKMIATVNVGSENSRGKMAKWVEKWETERKKRGVDIVVTPRHEDYW